MTENDAQVFEEVCRKFDANDHLQALQELRDLVSRIDDPWERAELNYREIMFLVEMHSVPEATQRLEDLKRTLVSLIGSPSDGYEAGSRFSLPVMANHAEIRVAIEEGKELEGLRLIESFISRYPKQLSLPDFRPMVEEITTLRGFLLGNAGRWADARPFLEQAPPPKGWKGQHCYYLGRCYYEFQEYERARDKLVEALNLGLDASEEGMAHYILGIVEYHLSDMNAAKRQFELSVKTADQTYLGETIWGWLEATSRALGLQAEAENYRKLKADSLPKSKTN
jgi:tetratricopeptide (TPR) repeat protein